MGSDNCLRIYFEIVSTKNGHFVKASSLKQIKSPPNMATGKYRIHIKMSVVLFKVYFICLLGMNKTRNRIDLNIGLVSASLFNHKPMSTTIADAL